MARTPFILGLTGGIGMGKSFVAGVLAGQGAMVFDSDKYVHTLMAPNGAAFAAIKKEFPDAIAGGAVDRKKLGEMVFNDAAQLARLERLLHPLVTEGQKNFIAARARARTRVVVLEIPLLFETGAAHKTDAVACVYAPPFVQRPRVLARPGMSEERLDAIEKNQFSAELKCAMADFVISTRAGREQTLRETLALLHIIKELPARAWAPGWG